MPPDHHFSATLPGTVVLIRITSLYEAQIFLRRWVIRDGDLELKKLLRRLERANCSNSAYDAIAAFKRMLMQHGLFLP
jgi:hypothetical protein